jgi:hypothetical protein
MDLCFSLRSLHLRRKAQEFRIRIEGFVGDGKHDKCSEHRLGPDETFRSGMIFLILRSNGAIFV